MGELGVQFQPEKDVGLGQSNDIDADNTDLAVRSPNVCLNVLDPIRHRSFANTPNIMYDGLNAALCLCRRKLSKVKDFQVSTEHQLSQIEKVAQNARTTWFGLLAVLVFVGVTLMGHSDSDFFAFGAATQLPLVNIEVPPRIFFYAAPVLTSALYIYLHVYLAQLWPALGCLPLRIEGIPTQARVYPSILTRTGLFLRRKLRREPLIYSQAGDLGSLIIALAMTWCFGPIILGFLWWRSMPLHSEFLTCWIVFWLWLSITLGVVSFWNLIHSSHKLPSSQNSSEHRAEPMWAVRWLAVFIIVIGLPILLSISWLRTEGGLEYYWERYGLAGTPWFTSKEVAELIPFVPLAQAQLAEAELTRRPADWLDYEEWQTEYSHQFRKRYDLGPELEHWPEHHREALIAELPIRWLALTQSLDKKSLRGADLRGADLESAFLVGIDLRDARLQHSELSFARLDGAKLSAFKPDPFGDHGANLEDSRLYYAHLNGADLSQARMMNVALEGSQLRWSYLEMTDLRAANLRSVEFLGANVATTNFSGSDLSAANMARANFGHPEFVQTHIDVGMGVYRAWGNCLTNLPHNLPRPDHWPLDSWSYSYEQHPEYPDWLASGSKQGKASLQEPCRTD